MGPENRTVVSNDNFLRANLIGDLVGYTNIPSFEDFYLVIPRQVYAYSTTKAFDGTFCNRRFLDINAYNGKATLIYITLLVCSYLLLLSLKYSIVMEGWSWSTTEFRYQFLYVDATRKSEIYFRWS